MTEALFSPAKLGAIEIPNRIVMAPMTRSRAGDGDVPTETMVEYYRQRAGAGLIITEGTQPSAAGKGYWRTPGIWSKEQAEGWAKVAAAVHEGGGRIVMQLMHCGRVVVPENRGYDAEIVGPSNIALPGKIPGPDGVPVATAAPQALAALDLPRVASEFGMAARAALLAGFDGVELHCAGGYLIDQFLDPVCNTRTDDFGGDAKQRAVFPAMVLAALAGVFGADRVGMRIAPGNPYNGMDTSDPREKLTPLLKAAQALGLAYCHPSDVEVAGIDVVDLVREHYSGALILNNELSAEAGARLIKDRGADAVSFGRAFAANPDLVDRMRQGFPLAEADRSTFYTGEESGYTDYPAYSAS